MVIPSSLALQPSQNQATYLSGPAGARWDAPGARRPRVPEEAGPRRATWRHAAAFPFDPRRGLHRPPSCLLVLARCRCDITGQSPSVS